MSPSTQHSCLPESTRPPRYSEQGRRSSVSLVTLGMPRTSDDQLYRVPSDATLVNPSQPPPPYSAEPASPSSEAHIIRRQKSRGFGANFCRGLPGNDDELLSSFDMFIHPKAPKPAKQNSLEVAVEVVHEEWDPKEEGPFRRLSRLLTGRKPLPLLPAPSTSSGESTESNSPVGVAL